MKTNFQRSIERDGSKMKYKHALRVLYAELDRLKIDAVNYENVLLVAATKAIVELEEAIKVLEEESD